MAALPSAAGGVEVVEGYLLDAGEQYIVHQTNCLTRRGHTSADCGDIVTPFVLPIRVHVPAEDGGESQRRAC